MGNMGYESIELVELARPLLVWETAAVTDSGGAGEYRGAVGIRHRIQPLDHSMHINFCGSGHTCAAFGLFGASDGSPADHWIADQRTEEVLAVLPNAGMADIQPTQTWVACTGGGGGYGDPRHRSIQAVLDDVVDGFISTEAARSVYGVAVEHDGHRYKIDEPRTRALRGEA
jgi:N-methylhydantoinase B